MKKVKTFDVWLLEFKAKHGDRYTYKALTRVDNKPYVTYVCAVHGEVTQLAGSHAMGKGCRLCGFLSTAAGIQEFAAAKNCDTKNAARCREVHGDTYKYLETFIKNGKRFTRYVCDEHGEVTQQLGAHIRGQGCPTCATLSKRYDFDRYKEDCQKVHGARYTYIGMSYDKVATVSYLCPEHGKVEQLAADHLRGCGCKECAKSMYGKANANSVEEWKSKFREAHGDTYLNYEIVRGSRTYVYYECRQHGPILQEATSHAAQVGCSRCKTGVMGNKHTQEIAEYVRGLGLSVVEEHNFYSSRKRWDIVVPDAKISIEFDGVYYHSEKFKTNNNAMLDRAVESSSHGYRQINIWEDEWYEKKQIVKRLIASACGVSTDTTVFARRTKVVSASRADVEEFLDANHIQGFTSGSNYVGLLHRGSLVACMVYSYKTSGRSTGKVEDCVDIQRYATSCQVVGGFQKLLKQVLLDLKVTTVISYSDPRLFSGGMYTKAGFRPSPESRADYCYIKGTTRFSKQSRQKSWFKDREGVLYDPSLTESELATLNGYYRLWFRGKVKWTLRVPQASLRQASLPLASPLPATPSQPAPQSTC